MSPSQRHEEIGYRFELFMVPLAQALRFKFAGMAHTTIEVPEAWRFDGENLSIHLLQVEGGYIESDRRLALPFVRPEKVVFCLKRSFELNNNMAWMREVQDLARPELAPRLNRP